MYLQPDDVGAYVTEIEDRSLTLDMTLVGEIHRGALDSRANMTR